jgi:hypothetical protein
MYQNFVMVGAEHVQVTGLARRAYMLIVKGDPTLHCM